TQFVAIEVDHSGSIADLEAAIAASLQSFGEPLRWAITAVVPERSVVRVEAVVTPNPLNIFNPQSIRSV
ncbi:MAG TPA: hypothetical protein V6C88_19555, partial [Chroococcidiopsis sp.]